MILQGNHKQNFEKIVFTGIFYFFPGLFRAIFRGRFHSRAFSVIFRVSGLVGHPEAMLQNQGKPAFQLCDILECPNESQFKNEWDWL